VCSRVSSCSIPLWTGETKVFKTSHYLLMQHNGGFWWMLIKKKHLTRLIFLIWCSGICPRDGTAWSAFLFNHNPENSICCIYFYSPETEENQKLFFLLRLFFFVIFEIFVPQFSWEWNRNFDYEIQPSRHFSSDLCRSPWLTLCVHVGQSTERLTVFPPSHSCGPVHNEKAWAQLLWFLSSCL